jgi:hypothetical protein
MAVCHLATIGSKDKSLEFSGPEGAHWRAPLAAIRALGQYRSSADDNGHFLAVIIDDSGAWLQAPCNAVGVEQLLLDLSHRWSTTLTLERADALPAEGRLLWPERMRGEALFEREGERRGRTLNRKLEELTKSNL